MEAVRLINATRDALAESEGVPDIVAEAWQTQALVEAVGSHLAVCGPPELRAAACELSEAGGKACGSLRRPPLCARTVRATRITAIKDPSRALHALSDLLGASGVALVRVATTAAEHALYWQCIEAIDAADESDDRVTGMLRRLELREQGPVARAAGPPPGG